MKKSKLIFVLALLPFIFVPSATTPAQAVDQTSAPYTTYTIGPKGRYISTQTAYEPAGILSSPLDLLHPEDMYFKDDWIYVADTGNRRIVKINEAGDAVELITGLNIPTGVHVDENDNIYVADKGDQVVKKYDALGTLLQTFGRPTEAIFGELSPYVPTKVVTGPRGNLYVAGEGSTGGLMQFNYSGEFLGFFATNSTSMTWFQKLAKLFNVTLSKNIPVSPLNLAIDAKGSVFTVSTAKTIQLKKFNIASTAVMQKTTLYSPVAVTINDFDNIYTISSEGMVTEYDSYGNLIFEFGGLDKGNQVLGLFVNPVDIAVDTDNNLLILDKAASKIQLLQKSEFTELVHQGLIAFKNGIYSVEQWEEVLRMNSVFALANSAIARAEYRQGNYASALEYYRIAYDRSGYSEAFWQIRYQWMQDYLGVVFLVMAILILAFTVLKTADSHFHIYQPLRVFDKKLNDHKLIRELRLIFRMFRHPLDTFYDIKKMQKASYLSATIIYAVILALSILSVYATSFIFNSTDLETFSIFRHTAIVLGVIVLFVFSNYLISTISSGEGWFKDVYIGTAYALAPYVVFTLPIIILSHGLTLHEIFIFQSILSLRDIWCVILVIVMIKEIHNYTVWELIKNILLTAFTMLMIVLVLFLIYLLVNQMYGYIAGIIKEVILRA